MVAAVVDQRGLDRGGHVGGIEEGIRDRDAVLCDEGQVVVRHGLAHHEGRSKLQRVGFFGRLERDDAQKSVVVRKENRDVAVRVDGRFGVELER